MYEIVPATVDHAHALAPNLREADIAECWASFRHTPLEALLRSLSVSRDARSGIVDGEVVCMFGVGTTTLLSLQGSPWLLGSDQIKRHARIFLPQSRLYVAEMHRRFPVLKNFVDARNAVTLRWLRWLGFRIDAPVPFGPDRLPFNPFEMVRGWPSRSGERIVPTTVRP